MYVFLNKILFIMYVNDFLDIFFGKIIMLFFVVINSIFSDVYCILIIK